ncbi:MAG: hypothetical protein WCK76_08575 [Elusimicrobiota bacterium]
MEYAVLLIGLIALGIYGVYYGVRYQQCPEGEQVGRELGFSPTVVGASSEDSYYTAKGRANAIETLVYILQNPAGRRTGAWYKVEVMCRAANPAGIELEIYNGILNRPLRFSLPPRVRGVAGWDNFVVRCNSPEAAARLLSAVMPDTNNVFKEGSGFLRLGLKGGKLQAYFRLNGFVGTDYVAKAVEEVSKLAALANLG